MLAAVPGATVDARVALADTVTRIASVLSSTGRPAEAETESRTALAISQKLVDENPVDAGLRSALAQRHLNLGALLIETGRPSDAERELREALKIYRTLTDDYSGVIRFWSQMSQTHNNLGLVLSGIGRRPEAEAELRAALTIQRKLADEHPAVAGLCAEPGGQPPQPRQLAASGGQDGGGRGRAPRGAADPTEARERPPCRRPLP